MEFSKGILLILAIGYDITVRYLFATPNFWAYTYMIYGGYTMLGAAYCHCLKGHVRMDLLQGRLSERNKAITDVICYLLLFFPLFSVLLFAYSIFYLKGINVGLDLPEMYRGVISFVGLQILVVVIIIIFPDLCLWLPRILSR